MLRNYIGELHSIGYTYKSMAQTLGISARRVSAIGHQTARAGSDYEAIRNLHRNTISQELQAQGFHGKFVSSNRRGNVDKIVDISRELNSVADKTYQKWNSDWLAYKRNPADWKARHGYRYYKGKGDKRKKWHLPKELKRDEVQRRIQKGASKVKDLDDVESDDGQFVSPVVEDEDKESGDKSA